jgi:hypothetical protein
MMRWLARILPSRNSDEAGELVAERLAAAHAASERQDYETALAIWARWRRRESPARRTTSARALPRASASSVT